MSTDAWGILQFFLFFYTACLHTDLNLNDSSLSLGVDCLPQSLLILYYSLTCLSLLIKQNLCFLTNKKIIFLELSLSRLQKLPDNLAETFIVDAL